MPMDRSRYPDNWEEIALRVKKKAKWCCSQCGLECIPSGQFANCRLTRSEKARYTLTVHHSDYDPSNNKPRNLIALCSCCHLQKHRGGKKNITPGQLSLKLKL